jgi:hypothetical protein
MGDDIDDLIDRLGELDPEERRELSRRMQADWARRVGDAQRAYLERLEEENLVGGGGKVFQPIPGEEGEWIEYCREHPNDPICLLGAPAVGDRLSDFLDIREEYFSHLEEEGLVDVEAASGRPSAHRRGNPSPQPNGLGFESPVGLTPPPDPWPPWPWPPEWPPWPWPGPWPYADDGQPLPMPADSRPIPMPADRRRGFDARSAMLDAGRGRRSTAVDPRSQYTPGSGSALSRVGLTPPPDPWPWPPWPWPPEWPPWPWPGPRPDPFDGNPIPMPANRW